MSTQDDVRKLRARLNHPVVDGDGHIIESMANFYRYLAKIGGDDMPDHYREEIRARPMSTTGDRERWEPKAAWWAVPNDARDLATVMAPKLLHERMDELGLDFALLYPSLGLTLHTIQDEKVRRTALRALNTINAEAVAPYQDRMTSVSMIPMHTPEEAVDEIEYVATKMDVKACVIPAGVARAVPALQERHPGVFPYACRMDCYGLDSEYDYSPVWEALRKYRVAGTFHGAPAVRYLQIGRRSPTSYMHNHILAHAQQQTDLCLSLVLGGVPKRYPDVTFAFLEGGAGWAADLLHGIEEHYEKRNAEGIANYDPSKLDRRTMGELLARYAPELIAANGDRGGSGSAAAPSPADYAQYDEFRESLLESEDDLADMFGRQFYFGCEADDMSVYRALDAKGNPMGVRLKAFFSSDIGHWDVPDISSVLLESHQLVDKGLISDADYRDFVFTYPAGLHLSMNPHFFDGTPVESAAKELAREVAAT
jgi:predicted TIM-barrel fold metal-dependent hydrolase